ncbi:NERD domain-containing protein, partial [Schumannella luteola]
TRAIYNQNARNVRHLVCAQPVEAIDRGTAGASARREYERREARDTARHEARVAQSKANVQAVFGTGFVGRVATFLAVDDGPARPRQSTRAWETGAVGEERVAERLDALGEVGVIALHDRRIPGTKANIDHLVVTPWGVWVVDAKRYRGKVDFDVVDSLFGFGGRKRLLVNRRDKTSLVDGVERQVAKVKEALGAGIDVNGCLCFVDAEWPLLLADFSVRDVYVCWPKKLARTLLKRQEPLLDPEPIARMLASAFPAA